MKRFKAPIGDQSGQAVVEYILILVIVLAIVLGGLTQFSTAFRSYASNYFGSYLTCLLETGEIPSFGGDTGKKDSGGACNDSYKPFSIADGRPAKGEGIGASGSGSDSKSGSGSGSGRGGGGGGGSGDNTRIGGLNGSFARASGRPVTALEKGSNKDEAAPGDAGVGGGSRALLKGAEAQKAKNKDVAIKGAGGLEDEIEEARHGPKKIAETAENRLRKKKELVLPPRKPAAVADSEDDQGMSFGYLFKWLLIAAIILALVVFLGGQALSISKSQE